MQGFIELDYSVKGLVKNNFDTMIALKYPKGTIYDITSGVKHIKLTKYYSGKPVKINIVEG